MTVTRTHQILFAPTLIIVSAVVLAFFIFQSPLFVRAAGDTATGCGNTIVSGLDCQAGEPVPQDCAPTEMAYERTVKNHWCPTNGWGWYGSTGYCLSDPSCSACTPSSACAANTCSTSSCTDTCGNAYAGTKNCTPPPPTCADLGYSAGTYPSCYNASTCVLNQGSGCASSGNACGMTNSGTVTCDGSCSVTAPSDSLCPTSYSEGAYAGCGIRAVTLTASPNRVKSGQTSTLSLSGTGITTSCVVTGPGINTTVSPSSCAASRTITTPSITRQSVYKVSCDLGAATAQAIVNLIPNVIEY